MISFIKRQLSKVTAPSLIKRAGGESFFIISLLLFLSCTDSRTFRLTGTLENLRTTDFFIYSTDGSLTDLDTIHIQDGEFDWTTPLGSETTLHLVYSNLNEQIVFARPGDHVHFKGDANQLRAVRIEGNPENDELTRFRLEHLQVSPDSLHRAMKNYINNHPESRVSSYLQRQLTLSSNTSQVRKGRKLPAIVLPPDTASRDSLQPHSADTLRILPTDTAGRPVLLFFWATWKSDSRKAASDIREARRKTASLPDSLRLLPISISLDFDTRQYAYSLRADSIDYDRRRYPQLWDAPICELLAVREIPYYILVGADRRVLAAGNDWKKDIKPEIDKLIQ